MENTLQNAKAFIDNKDAEISGSWQDHDFENCLVSYAAPFAAEVERLKSELSRMAGEKWVSVDERLPDADEFVLFYYPNRFEKPLIGCYKTKQGTKGSFLCTEDNEDWIIEVDGITHWKKLEPPQIISEPDKDGGK